MSKVDGQIQATLCLLDPEDPSPSCVMRNDTTQNWTQDASNRNDQADHARHPLSHLRCVNMVEYNKSKRIQARATHALDSSAGNQCFDRMSKAATNGEGEKDGECANVSIPRTDDVADARKERGASEIGQQIGEDYPVDNDWGVKVGSYCV